jgi:hypothetical protein
MNRRSFLAYGVGMMAASAGVAAQTAIMENKKAVVCPAAATKCPNGHDTCKTIDLPLVVGSGTYQNPDVAPINGKNVIECDQCHVLFIA